MQQDFYYGLPWLSKSFGRAWGFKEADSSADILKVPKCYMGEGEYQNVLPNDSLTSQSFIAARTGEETIDFSKATVSSKERLMSCIFWFNLKEINPSKDYIFTEELKYDVERILKQNPYVKTIESYFDEQVEQVFDGYLSNAEYARYTIDDPRTQFLMYPYSGFRFDFRLAYAEHDDCSGYMPGLLNPLYNIIDDIQFVVGDTPGAPAAGTTTYQNDLLKGKKVRLTRSGLKVLTSAVADKLYWSFNADTGTITVNPEWSDQEGVSIEIYGVQ